MHSRFFTTGTFFSTKYYNLFVNSFIASFCLSAPPSCSSCSSFIQFVPDQSMRRLSVTLICADSIRFLFRMQVDRVDEIIKNWYQILGSPYLFQEYDYPVDPYRSAKLSGAFQAANGRRGAKLVAYFGTGGLRSVERPAIPIHSYHKWVETYITFL